MTLSFSLIHKNSNFHLKGNEWNKSTNEITPLIDGTIGIATVEVVEPFSNADFFHYALV